ncbi:PD-(D/E)XK nuclease family protein [Streptomyces sp. NPDC015127]|uniref:PD-(D/E)XK nuclease family protein n=1 Tax=Streptomyces sp. NPDC015127 TaxID=3364939 RepID=UPI0036FC5927
MTPRHTKSGNHTCPDQIRTAVRPLVGPPGGSPFLNGPLQEFATTPLHGCLDLIELEGRPIPAAVAELHRTRGVLQRWWSPAHPVHLRWTEEALARYVDARTLEQNAAKAAGLPPTEPVADHWVWRTPTRSPDPRGVRQYEHTVTGRRYQSADGLVRDLWLTSMGRAKAVREAAELAAMALVLALGGNGPKPKFGKASPAEASYAVRPPERVRVFDFGCADGSHRLLLDWDQDECTRRFRDHAAPAFTGAATTAGSRPGGACVECKAIEGCEALERAPLLWPGRRPQPRRPRRSVSAWDLRLYRQCPAQFHLTRRLHLDALEEEGDGARRGRAVDAWLNEAHALRPPRGCHEVPLPADPEDWSAGAHRLQGHLATEAFAMLREHRSVCPLDRLGSDEQVLTQERVTAYVPELDVVVISVPDLLYTRRGGWVWRETKSEAKPLWEGEPLMSRYPQLALGVLLLAAGTHGADPRRSWVELEVLHGSDVALEKLDPGRTSVVDEAREVVASLTEPLLHDTEYVPRTGYHCLGCEARPWCEQGTAYADARATPSTSEDAAHA